MMNREEIVTYSLRKILAKLKQVNIDELSFRDDDNFLEILNMDSLDSVEFTLCLNEEFDIVFGDDINDIDSLNSFGGLVKMVLARSPKFQFN